MNLEILNVIKSVPLWTSAATSAASCCLLFLVRAPLPPDFIPWLWIVLVFSLALFFTKLADLIGVALIGRLRVKQRYNRDLFNRLYRPLYSLFIHRRPTSYQISGAPKFHMRVENAWEELRAYRRPSVGINRAFRSLFDKQVTETYEIEYADFPFDQINRILNDNIVLADSKLLHLVSRAGEARREKYESDQLVNEEWDLYSHIERQHRKLENVARRISR